MHRRLSVGLLILLLAAAPAMAQFEGVLEMKLSSVDKDGASLGGGTMKLWLGKEGTRSELDMQHGAMGINMVMLQRHDQPDKLYNLNQAAHTYTELDLNKAKALGGQGQTQYTVQKLGQEKLLGYNTQHVLVKEKAADGAEGPAMELWTAKDFLDYETFTRLQFRHGRPGAQESLVKALKEADAEGMPLKSVSANPDGSKTTWEVVKAEKQSVPASSFEIPAGYTKSEGGIMDLMGNMSGPQGEAARKQMEEAHKKMQEALKNMTPEQRKMFEDMMKQHQAHP